MDIRIEKTKTAIHNTVSGITFQKTIRKNHDQRIV